ncbi:hypothetical protein WN51_06310 [Melipona quadrifasciata]|uniref:Uncharacterized protein n=1 Tax=Melipona quadrifasciata TaxID=166423 RepID=A0A0M8ZQZ5_9HYME|nr:hypothetical protein WN51_06310 [Melipona quadrifasciata]
MKHILNTSYVLCYITGSKHSRVRVSVIIYYDVKVCTHRYDKRNSKILGQSDKPQTSNTERLLPFQIVSLIFLYFLSHSKCSNKCLPVQMQR